jgi:alkylation response protein AidB-like acyl-CoA dehydrogenase
MQFELGDEERMVRDLVRDFAEKELRPGAAERDEESRPEPALLARMGELGLLGLPVPEAYGGSGGTYLQYAIAVEEVARVCASTALSYAAHVSLGIGALMVLGTEAQKRRWLAPAARGETLVAFGLTEPGAGSDAAGTRTTARREGDGWVLNGAKCFITNGASAGVSVVTAVTRPGEGVRGISAFLVPKGTPGFTARATYRKLGMRASETAELFFDNCRLPADALMGEEGQGFVGFMKVLDAGRISIGALGVGIAQAALEASLAYAKTREQFGRPIGSFQAIQFKLADMATAVELARLAVYRAAWLKDQGRPFGKEAAMAKLYASEVATRAAGEAIQIHGGYGYIKEYPVERYWRDAKLLEIGEGTSEVQRLVIARHLGLPS